jgi:hypothetical protein
MLFQINNPEREGKVMNKQILSIILAAVICLSAFPCYAASLLANVDANYADGIVKVTGTGFISGMSYTIRVVDAEKLSIKAMGQAAADGSGRISAAITTGTLEIPGNYKVYVNSPDGTLVASDEDIDTFTNGGRGNSDGGVIPVPAQEVTVTKADDTTIIFTTAKAIANMAAGTAAARIEKGTLNLLTEKVKEAEDSGQKVMVEIKVDLTANVDSIEVVIPRDAFKKIADTAKISLKVDLKIGALSFDEKAVFSIANAQSEGDIVISVGKLDKASLNEEVRAKVGNRPVHDFSLRSGNNRISNFNGGKAEVSIPYIPDSGEQANSIIVYYIDNAGNAETVKRGRFDSKTGTVRFTTSHFSRYAVGYNDVDFIDIPETAWYSEAVGFMSARGIISGIGDGKFEPQKNIIRADFLIMVMNSYDIEPDTDVADNFADAGSKYYTNYLGTAKRLGLVTGIGGNRFAPEETISRQDMCVILHRALDILGELPTGTDSKGLESFIDADEIAGYAKEAVKLFAETGIITGDGNTLKPRTSCTRAEATQVLYRLISRINF